VTGKVVERWKGRDMVAEGCPGKTLPDSFSIREMGAGDLALVTDWARREGFCPGPWDVAIMRHADRRGGWVGCLDGQPVGCVMGVRYDDSFGFIGLFLVRPEHRGHGYGVALWQRAMHHLRDVACIGLEAAPERLRDYGQWGFRPAHHTLRWSLPGHQLPSQRRPHCLSTAFPPGFRIVPAHAVSEPVVMAYDARHEATPRPLFLREWLQPSTPGDAVLVVLDEWGCCRGFARIRVALLPERECLGWRIGPWLADHEALAGGLLDRLCGDREGPVLVDAPETNPRAGRLLERRGFHPTSSTIRMYRGTPPGLPIQDIYGLACLELG